MMGDAQIEGVEPIHDQFVKWFTWMFANQMVACSFICIAPVIMFIGNMSPTIGNICGGLSLCAFKCSLFVAYIMGLIWRFGAAGKFASGDELAEGEDAGALYQISSGKFISIYYLITWILLGTMCVCACGGACVSKM